ncbi:hypothetical protein [Dyadobacter arcticus]|uniref:Uncharacterized protein n=1 Tax=Dyadobacter arcticus TaxID=1078754 RepID=A0ABX0UWS4_9BACT|nr:hypothetical protein [Dyadobacter arcticus]NIJ55386.1 hypothetical protein [Dyadobacter arcticus]
MKIQLIVLFSLIYETVMGQKSTDKQEWKQLFNWKNLDGFDIKVCGYDLNNNYNDTFRVEAGKMVVSDNKYDDFNKSMGTFSTKVNSYCRTLVEYRFVSDQE